jgi:hypothetical protein
MSLQMTATAETLRPAKREPVPPPVDDRRPPLRLHKAQHYASKISEWIAPHCRQVEPVGEIRRRCSTVAAVELLVMPRYEANANKLFDFLTDYVEEERSGMAKWRHCTGRTDLHGVPPGHYDDSATLLLPRCVLVLHTATPENWFLRLFESTGSAAHVASIMERVRSLPGTWEPGEQIRVRSKTIKPVSEGHIYDVLNMSLVVPWRRLQ